MALLNDLLSDGFAGIIRLALTDSTLTSAEWSTAPLETQVNSLKGEAPWKAARLISDMLRGMTAEQHVSLGGSRHLLVEGVVEFLSRYKDTVASKKRLIDAERYEGTTSKLILFTTLTGEGRR